MSTEREFQAARRDYERQIREASRAGRVFGAASGRAVGRWLGRVAAALANVVAWSERTDQRRVRRDRKAEIERAAKDRL